MRSQRRPLRRWPGGVILIAGAAGQAWTWLRDEPTRQHRVMESLGYGLLTVLLLLLWLLLFSRLPGKVRAKLLGGTLLLALVAGVLVEIRGVSGDLVPQLAWRWSPAPASEPLVVKNPPPRVAGAPESSSDENPSPEGSSVGIAAPGNLLADSSAEGLGPEMAPAAAPLAAAPLAAPPRDASGDFPQFLGPHRDARLPGLKLARDWMSHPPREVWRRAVGAGWSGFAVAGGLALTQEQRGEEDLVVAYDLETGEPVWSHADGARFDVPVGGVGPRATPTISGERVFTLGGTAILNALDLRTGRRLWSHDLAGSFAGAMPEWGRSNSALVLEVQPAQEGAWAKELVIVPVGGGSPTLWAFDAATGEEVWSGGDGGVSYSSPMAATLGGRFQVVIFNSDSVSGHDPEDGHELWSFPWSANQPNVAQPIILGPQQLLISSGYGVGSSLLRITPGEDGELRAVEQWHSPRLKLKFTQAVELDGYLYGLDDGVMTCLDPRTGERCWKGGRFGHGQILLVGDLLLVQAESGELILVEPNPEELRELGRLQALSGHAWNTLALAPPYLLLRNHREAACYRLVLAAGEG